MILILLSLIVAVIVVAISVFRHHIVVGCLNRSEIGRGDFSIAQERAKQSSVAGPFLVIVLPDGKIITPRAAEQL
jgi:hypothetical protein